MVLSLQYLYNAGVMTFFQMNREYIAEVLCINKEEPVRKCNGQCFLKKNLDVSDSESSGNGTVPPVKVKFEFPVFVMGDDLFLQLASDDQSPGNPPCLADPSCGHCENLFRPPAKA